MNDIIDFPRIAITAFCGAVLAVVIERCVRAITDEDAIPWLIAFCAFMMAMLGLTHLKTDLRVLFIPWTALGSAIVALFLLWLFTGRRGNKARKCNERNAGRMSEDSRLVREWQQSSDEPHQASQPFHHGAGNPRNESSGCSQRKRT